MTLTVHTPLRTTLSVAALAALTLTACGDDNDDAAEFEAAGADATADAQAEGSDDDVDEGPDLPQVDSGFTYEDLSQNVTVTDTQRPENDEVITPTGTLSIDEVETIESVAPEEVGLEPQYEDDGEDEEDGAVDAVAEPLDYAPAEGEEFRVLNLSFTPDEEADHGTSTSVAISDSGAQDHLFDLNNPQDFRVLVSASDEAQLVISADGHDQYVDIHTGEREEDEIAAGYYREITKQDPNHTFPIDTSVVATNRDDDIEVEYDFHISSVSLAGWSEDEGWAPEGEAWLIVDWRYEVTTSGHGMNGVDDLEATLSVDVEGEELSDRHYDEGGRGTISHDLLTHVAVPIDTVDVELSFSGSAEAYSGSNAYEITEDPGVSFETDELEVSFPDERFGSDASEVDEADEENDEDSDDDADDADAAEDIDDDQDDDAEDED